MDNQHNEYKHNNAQHWGTQNNQTQLNDTQYSNNGTIRISTRTRTTISLINAERHIIWLFAECCYAECHSADCRGAVLAITRSTAIQFFIFGSNQLGPVL